MPGGQPDETDADGLETATREFAEEVFGATGPDAVNLGRQMVMRIRSSGLEVGPYGSTMIHEAYAVPARLLFGSMAQLLAAFSANENAPVPGSCIWMICRR